MLRHGQGGGREVDPLPGPAWPFAEQSQQNGAGTGAEIEHVKRCVIATRQNGLDQCLGIGARGQHIACNLQIQRPEWLRAQHLRKRHTLEALPGEIGQITDLLPGHELASGQSGFQPHRRQGVLQQEARLNRRIFDPHRQQARDQIRAHGNEILVLPGLA